MNREIIIPLVALAAIIPSALLISSYANDEVHDDRIYTTTSSIYAGGSEENIAATATYIVEGELIKAVSREIVDRPNYPEFVSAVTDWTLDVDHIYKGAPAETLTFMRSGGETDRAVTEYEGLDWEIGDNVFVYLSTEDDGTHSVYAGVPYSYVLRDYGIAESYVPWNSKLVGQLRSSANDKVYDEKIHAGSLRISSVSEDEIAASAAYIVEGELVRAVPGKAVRDPKYPDFASAATDWTLDVGRIYKGTPAETLTFTRDDESDSVISEYRGFDWKVGDDVFVYLSAQDDGTLSIYGGVPYSYILRDDGVAESPILWKSKPIGQLREQTLAE